MQVRQKLHRTDERPRLEFVDALRGLAALYVLLYHMVLVPSSPLGVPVWLKPLVMNGGSGVTLFFVVSAFTLCLTLEPRRLDPFRDLGFYVRRVFRIVPLYYLWLFLMVYLVWGSSWFNHEKDILRYALFAFNFSPNHYEGLVWASWTLGIEMVFYLLFPLIFRVVTSRKRAVGFLGLSLLGSLLHAGFVDQLVMPGVDVARYRHMSFFFNLPVFALGMLTYYQYKKFLEVDESTVFRVLLGAGTIGFFGLPYIPKELLLVPSTYVMAVVYSALLIGLSRIPVRLVVNRITVFFGLISYSLYLNHPQLIYRGEWILKRIYKTDMPVWIQLGACFALTIVVLSVVSWLTYVTIEKPGMLIGSRVIRWLRSSAVTEGAGASRSN